MGVSSKLDEGKIYRFLQTALKLRSLQKVISKTPYYKMTPDKVEVLHKVNELEILFDAQLDAILENVDEVDTDRVINKMNGL